MLKKNKPDKEFAFMWRVSHGQLLLLNSERDVNRLRNAETSELAKIGILTATFLGEHLDKG